MTEQNPLVEFVDRYYDQPALLVREVLGGNPDEKQEAVMAAVARGAAGEDDWKKISVRSGHGVGKSTLVAWLFVWFACTRFPMKCLATAPTASQLFDALAAETKTWFRKLPPVFSDPDTGLFEIKSDRIVHRSAPDESFIAFATSRAETPEALAGKHSANMLIVADEASGVPEPVFEASMGSLAGPRRVMLLTGNPVRTSGLFFDTHHKLRGEWKTFHISCENHPRIPASFAETMAARYGRDSNEYRVRVQGEFPLQDENTIIPFHLVESALNRQIQPNPKIRPVWGLDVARGGGDTSALAKRHQTVLLEPVKTVDKHDLMEVVGWVVHEWNTTPEHLRPSAILVDVIGMGAGVCDRLIELGLPARGINVGEAPAFSTGAECLNLRAELWYVKGREFFRKRDCSLSGDEKLASELTQPTYQFTSSGKIKVESKDDLKKRKVRSPNRADAFLLTLAEEAVAANDPFNSHNWQKPLSRRIKGIV